MTSIRDRQLSIHAPSVFLQKHWQKFLPDWTEPVRSVILLLQRSAVPLCDRTLKTELCKKKCRQHFLKQGSLWRHLLTTQGYEAEVFDPRSGAPLYSQPGVLILDDVALVHALLNYPVIEQGHCRVLRHPDWSTGVFPSTILCSATPDQATGLLIHDLLIDSQHL